MNYLIIDNNGVFEMVCDDLFDGADKHNCYKDWLADWLTDFKVKLQLFS